MKNRNVTFITIFLALGCLALLPRAHAVVPAPDGCYPGFTTAEGCNALQFLGAGAGNTGVGWYSLYLVGDANYNTGVGAGTLALNSGDSNTAVGTAALLLNTTGSANTAVGTDALVYNDTGSDNTAVGGGALFSNDSGLYNSAFGNQTLSTHVSGDRNTAVGTYALQSDTMGERNTAIGVFALSANMTGAFNTAVGVQALDNNISGGLNTALGVGAGSSVTTASNVICIGANVSGADVSNSCFIGQIFGATSSGGTAVFVNSNGRLGTTTSSRRFKDDIRPMERGSEALLALKPVTFRYKKEIDPAGTSQFGLVAEEVEKVNPHLVVRDKEGKPYSVRYDQVNAMLLNEFLKEHRKVQELEANDAEQQREIKALAATVKEQAAQIQKVSAQIELRGSARQVVAENP